MYLNIKSRYYLRIKGWKEIFRSNKLKSKADVAILIHNKFHSKPKLIQREGEGHFIFIKGKILLMEPSPKLVTYLVMK